MDISPYLKNESYGNIFIFVFGSFIGNDIKTRTESIRNVIHESFLALEAPEIPGIPCCVIELKRGSSSQRVVLFSACALRIECVSSAIEVLV